LALGITQQIVMTGAGNPLRGCLRRFFCAPEARVGSESKSEMQVAAATLHANRLERRTLDGREYAVAPVVAMVAGVRNGELLPEEELGKFVGAWEGRPIPLRHPEDGEGHYITANAPTVIEASVLGSFFNARMDGDALKGELWLDVAKAQKLGGDALLALNRLEAGQVMEVSIAYFCEFEQAAGEFGGEAYSAIQRNLRPDHVALLPDEIGSCSVLDGCGANRVNRLTANAEGDASALDFSQSIMVAFYLRDEDAQALALPADAMPKGGEVLPASELHVTLAYLGEIPDVGTEFNAAAQRLADFAGWQVLLTATVAGVGRFANAEAGLDAVFLLLDGEGLHLFRAGVAEVLEWDLGLEVPRRWGYIPHVTLGYAPSTADVQLAPPAQRTLVFDRLALSWGDQTIVFPLRGEMRDAPAGNSEGDMAQMDFQDKKGAAAVKANCQGAPKVNEGETAEAQAPAVEEAAATLEGTVELPAELLELAQAVREFGGVQSLMEAVRGVKANSERQKAQSVARLAANSRCAFGKADLEAMTLDQLGKLEASLTPASYVGRGGAVADAGGEELRVFAPATAGAKGEGN
jgi:2'-5' RNA ligase